MINYQVDMQGFEMIERVRQYPTICGAELRKAMQKAVLVVEKEAKTGAPVGVSGGAGLRGSIGGQVTQVVGMDVVGRVGSPLLYARAVEEGTEPHQVPIEALTLWVERVIRPEQSEIKRVAFLVQRKIARHGTRAQPFLAPAFENNVERINVFFRMAAERTVQKIEKGGLA